MSLWADILGVGASAASGGLFGLLGTVIGRVGTYFEQQQAFAQKRAEWDHEVQLFGLQMQAKAAETEQEIALAAVQGSWSGLAASVQAEGQLPASYAWVNAVRALVRPALTLGLMIFLAAAFFVMSPGDLDRAYVADSLVFAAVTSIVWWFGDRAPKRQGRP